VYICNDAENAKALIIEALYLLKRDKEVAFRTVRDAYNEHAPGLVPFEDSDFSIPQLAALIEYLEGPDYGETVTLEPPEPMII
jgi:hypothetical protein